MNIQISDILEPGPSGYVEVFFDSDTEALFNPASDVEVNPTDQNMWPVDYNPANDNLYVCKFRSGSPGQLSISTPTAYHLRQPGTKYLYVVAWDADAGQKRGSRRTTSQVTDIKPAKV